MLFGDVPFDNVLYALSELENSNNKYGNLFKLIDTSWGFFLACWIIFLFILYLR